jgi:mRNA export factor
MQCLVTGSWDKTVKFWDGRSPNPVHSAMLPERVFCMDVKYPLCVVGTADRNIVIYDLRKPSQEFKVFKYLILN